MAQINIFFLFPLSHLLLNLSYIWIVPQLHYFIGGAIFGVLVSLVLVNKLSNFLEVMWSATYNLAKFLPRQAHNSNSALKWGNYKLNFHFEESECNFEFYLMYALVYVDKFCSISLRQKVECKHLFLPEEWLHRIHFNNSRTLIGPALL